MSAWSGAIALVRARPTLVLAWLFVLLLPAMLGFLPLDLALAPSLDLRPAADALVEAPADDALLRELGRLVPGLHGVAVAGLLVTLALGVPVLWLLAGWIAALALEAPHAPRIIAGRALGVALVALPLRALPWLGAAAIALGGLHAQTLAALAPVALAAVAFYLVTATGITVLVDFARGAALADLELGLFSVLGAGFGAARRNAKLALALGGLELASMFAALAPSALSRPLGLVHGLGLLLALVLLGARALAAVLGVAAAATGAATRSA